MHSCTDYIFLVSLRCAFSYAPVDGLLEMIHSRIGHICLVFLSCVFSYGSSDFLLDMINSYLWGPPMVCHMDLQKSFFLILKEPGPSCLYWRYLRATYDITHGLAKNSNLKFLKSPAVLSSLKISLRATHGISHGLAKISNLKFLKSSAALSSLKIYLWGPSLIHHMDLPKSQTSSS